VTERDLAQRRIPRLAPPARRRQIVQACVEAIADEGFSATSIREIAKRAGVSIGTLSHHFATKDEILLACMDQIMETWAEKAEEILTGPGTPLQRLDRLIDEVIGNPAGDYLWRAYMAFWHEAVFDTQTKSSILEGNVAWDRLVAACIAAAIDAGELAGENPDRIGKVLSTMMCGVAIHIQGRLGRWDRASGVELCKELLHAQARRLSLARARSSSAR